MRYAILLLAVLTLGVALTACGGNGNGNGGGAGGPAGPPELDAEPTLTESGLGIIDIETGSGATAQAGSIVAVHYTGWLAEDGTKFDSSLDRGDPIVFQLGVGRVIRGWDEGLAGMAEGGKRRLIIPPELGYGEQGRDVIPPNAELIFDVELVSVEEVTP